VVLVLVGVEDVGAMLIQQAGDACHQALLVRTVDEKNSRVFHVLLSLEHRMITEANAVRRLCLRGRRWAR
jgi:hypothetical protein